MTRTSAPKTLFDAFRHPIRPRKSPVRNTIGQGVFGGAHFLNEALQVGLLAKVDVYNSVVIYQHDELGVVGNDVEIFTDRPTEDRCREQQRDEWINLCAIKFNHIGSTHWHPDS